ncbi:hypothetical protein HG535_0F05800 [Zygotorulaspora mrakii]|uniref:Uncharacterized protein n=1 Tax=Zygotorulaspora mrakii TaxID=42260 RepID=A0A7H9B5T1_ZYGMR|nr:uncharacterized protein HG535_0F05800 [Zygotorulaspora mrakii]QLG74068.1 hypothetical protein HG535_0F05800 [Zygotorulaspora mrakii]
MSTATLSLLDEESFSGLNPKSRTIKARTHIFRNAVLFNVLPSNVISDTSSCEYCRLFSGEVYVEEFLNIHESGSVDQVPSYKLRFGWKYSSNEFFCQTEKIDNIHKLNEVITKWSVWHRIMMQCSGNRYVLLELQFDDMEEDRRFRDLVFRISDEFEILAELMWD